MNIFEERRKCGIRERPKEEREGAGERGLFVGDES